MMLEVVCRSFVALLVTVGLCAAVRYSVLTGRHPSSPLLQVATTSRVQCAVHCLTRTGCISWEVTGPDCLLYSGVTSDPTAATTSGPLWADPWIPAGYQMVPSTSRAFRAHNDRTISGTSTFLSQCAADHPRAAPAFFGNEEEMNFAKSLVTTHVWTGIKLHHDTIYGDYAVTRTVELPSTWFAAGYGYTIGEPCVRMIYNKGLDFNTCGDAHSFICEYELL